MTVRERIQQRLKRGKVDGTLYFQANKGGKAQWHINQELAQQLFQAMQQINVMTGNTAPPNAYEILRWQGVLEANTVDVEEIGETVLQHFDTALAQLVAHREREGEQLATLIEQRCDAIITEIEPIRNELPTILQAQRERLQNRLAELVELNSERLEQEMVILAQKMDIA